LGGVEEVMESSVQAVLFDLGNTLVTYYRAQEFPPILRQCITGVSEFLSARTSIHFDLDSAYRSALKLNVEDSENRVRLLEDRLLQIFRGSPITSETLAEMCSIFLRPIFRCAHLDPDAIPTLHALRNKGLRTAIVSNTPWGSSAEEWTAELHRHGLIEATDAIVFCVDVGWRKPAPQIFERALALLGVEPENAVFVGDDPRWDVAGAGKCGLHPILLDPTGDCDTDRCHCIRSLNELIPLLDTSVSR
jgi:HAD superfamily hydrolase (TIGR01509 family)